MWVFILSNCSRISIMMLSLHWKWFGLCWSLSLSLTDMCVLIKVVFVCIRLWERQSSCRHFWLLPHLPQAATPTARWPRVSVQIHNNLHVLGGIFQILLEYLSSFQEFFGFICLCYIQKAIIVNAFQNTNEP